MRNRTERTSLTELSPRRPAREVSPRKPAQENKRPLTSHEVEKGLRESLVSTDEGLKKFLDSLRQARMPEAVQGYRAMQMVLVQQRLWASEQRSDQLLPLFKSIAETAGEIHRIFASFADVMRPLKELDQLSTPEAAEPDKGG